jgi:tetratricopeptide (TPR) repeat protein
VKHFFFFLATVFITSQTYSQNAATSYIALVDEGVKLLSETKVVEAMDKFEQSLKVKPDGIEALYGMGVCLGAACAERDSACYRALDYLLKVEKLAGNYRFTYHNITSSYLKLSQYHQALEYCNKAISADGNDGESYYYRAFAHSSLGKTKEACDDAQKSLTLGYALAKQLSDELCR